MTKQRTEIESEHIVLSVPCLEVNLCRACGKPSPEVTIAQAMRLTGESGVTLHRMIEAGRLHHFEAADGRLRICAQSISQQGG